MDGYTQKTFQFEDNDASEKGGEKWCCGCKSYKLHDDFYYGSSICKSCYSKKRIHVYSLNKQNGRCVAVGCRNAAVDGLVTCENHRHKYTMRYKLRRRELKIETLNAYGGCRCVCCFDAYIESLSLEHQDGNGAEHRRMLTGNSKKGGTRFYAKLKKLGFPTDFRMVVFCMNCNTSRRENGICHHELERIKAREIEAYGVDMIALGM